MIEAFDVHVPKGYIYFAVFFSLLVEIINVKVRKKRVAAEPVKLIKQFEDGTVKSNGER